MDHYYTIFLVSKKLLIIFYLQINGQTKKQNGIIEDYLQVFINFQ